MTDLANDLACALDPVAFAHRLGVKLDPWQERVVRQRAALCLVLAGRQVGKSEAMCIAALHEAVYVPGSLILFICPSLRQSGEAFRRCMGMFAKLPTRPTTVEETKLTLTLANGSRIVSLPAHESTVRGFAKVSLLVEDEAAFVPDDLHDACRPMLATNANARMILGSSAGHKMGHFFTAWENAPNAHRELIKSAECSRISPEFLAREKAQMSARYYQREFECEFLDASEALFDTDAIRACLTNDVTPMFAPDPAPEDHPALSFNLSTIPVRGVA